MDNLTLTTALLFVAHWFIIIALSIRVIMRRLSAGVSLAWLVVVFGVPFVGALIYLLIGENRVGDKYQKRMARIHGIYSEWQRELRARASRTRSTIDGEMGSLQEHAESVVGFPPLQGNHIKLMDNFRSVFHSIISDLDHAKHSCHFEFFIWHIGGMADQVAEALIRAAERG